jgi:phospholipase/carboxylesterase
MRMVGETFLRVFPKMEIHIPNGVEKIENSCGRKWFFLEGNDFKAQVRSCDEKSVEIIDYISSVLSDKGFSCKDTVLAGFSQGAMLSLSLGFKLGVAGVISFSGMFIGYSEDITLETSKTKVFLAHGRQDEVVPFECFEDTEKALKKSGAYVETAVSPSVGHMIDNYLMTQALDFLKRL